MIFFTLFRCEKFTTNDMTKFWRNQHGTMLIGWFTPISEILCKILWHTTYEITIVIQKGKRRKLKCLNRLAHLNCSLLVKIFLQNSALYNRKYWFRTSAASDNCPIERNASSNIFAPWIKILYNTVVLECYGSQNVCDLYSFWARL